MAKSEEQKAAEAAAKLERRARRGMGRRGRSRQTSRKRIGRARHFSGENPGKLFDPKA